MLYPYGLDSALSCHLPLSLLYPDLLLVMSSFSASISVFRQVSVTPLNMQISHEHVCTVISWHRISKTKANTGSADWKLPFPHFLNISLLLLNPFSFIARKKMRTRGQEGGRTKRREKKNRKKKKKRRRKGGGEKGTSRKFKISFESIGEHWHAFFLLLFSSSFQLSPCVPFLYPLAINITYKTLTSWFLYTQSSFLHADYFEMQQSTPGCNDCCIELRSPCPLSKADQTSHLISATDLDREEGNTCISVSHHWHWVFTFAVSSTFSITTLFLAHSFDFPHLFTRRTLPNPFTYTQMATQNCIFTCV